ncbi:hypothetical protein GCM10028774_52750 [Spirosoma jeollabukense]
MLADINREGARQLSSYQSTFASVQNVVAGGFAVDKLLSFGSAITDASGKSEKFLSILTNGLQSGSGAKDQLRGLTDFAAETPNQLEELTGSFIKFVNRGLVPTKEQLTNFGDLAASQGKGFDQLTEAILDAQTAEFERLKEFGIRASKSGDQVTLSFKGVTQTVKNNSEAITGAIQKFGQLAGVAGSMSAVAQTQEGIVSNLSDTYDRLLVALGNSGISGGYKLALGAASDFLKVVTDLIGTSPVEDLRNQQSELNGLVGAIALANDNETVRLSLIQQLNQKYPEFLGNLGSESATTDLLARRLADVNTQYEKKIRIALGEEKIKKATEEMTAAIRVQQDALEHLALSSGKPITELEKLTSKQRIELAKQIAQQKKASEFRPSYFGQSAGNPADFIASALENGAAKQKKAQAELNKLMGDNTIRQADLTKTTVDGYQAQIKQIQEKIRLHQIDKKLGESEITRLQGQIGTTQGKPAVAVGGPTGSAYDDLKADVDAASKKIRDFVAKNGVKVKIPISLQTDYESKAAALKAAEDAVKDISPKSSTKTSGKSATAQQTGDLAILKRYVAELETQIQNLGGNASQELVDNLANARSAVESIQALTSKNQKTDILGINAILGPGTDLRAAAIVEQFGKLKELLPPGFFVKTGINDFLTDVQKARPSLEAIEKEIQAILATIAGLTLNNLAVPPKLMQELKALKEALAAATNAASSANAQTETGDGNDSKWTEKAQKRIDAMKAAGKKVNVTAVELGQQMKAAAMMFTQASFAALESIGTALGSGGDPLKAALQSITDTLGNYLVKQGEALALAALFEETAAVAAGPFAPLLSIPVGFQLAAAGVMIAGGAAVKGIGKYAKGGVFDSPTLGLFGEYPGAGSNKEIATPERLMAKIFKQELTSFSQLSSIKSMRQPDFAWMTDINRTPNMNWMSERLSRNSNVGFDRLRDRQPGPSTVHHKIEVGGVISGSDLKVILRRAESSAGSFGR